MYLPKFMFF